MTILFTCNRFYPAIGGVETHTYHLAKYLTQNHHKVEVFCTDFVDTYSSRRFQKKSKPQKIENIFVSRFFSLRFFRKDALTFIPALLFHLIKRRRKYDMIHTHGYGLFVTWMTIFFGTVFQKTIIFTPHYADETMYPKLVKKIFDRTFGSFSFQKAGRIIALTRREKENLMKRFSIEGKKIKVIPNGIDAKSPVVSLTDEERKKFLKKFNINNSKKNIIVVARLAKNKGHQYLLSGMRKIRNVNLFIVGDDMGEKKHLENLIQKFQLPNVYFFSQITNEDRDRFLSISECLVLPSIAGESFGIVLLEAMAQGTPVIASNVGGIEEIVIEGKNGYLVEPKDISSLQAKIKKIIRRNEKKKMKDFCMQFAREFDWKNIGEKILKFYTSRNEHDAI